MFVAFFKSLKRSAKAIEIVADELTKIRRLLHSHLHRPPNPGPLGFTLTGEGENQMIQGNVLLPDITQLSQRDQDEIVKGQLTVTTHPAGGGEGEPVVHDTDKMATTFPLEGEEDSHVHLSFVWIDNSGNASKAPATLDVNFIDNFPPVDPASLGFEVTGEV